MEKEAVHVFITFVVYIRAIVARVLRKKEERRSACLSADHVTASHMLQSRALTRRATHIPLATLSGIIAKVTWFNATLSITYLIFQ